MKNEVGSILKKEFTLRKKGNNKYSLRAFSRDLNLSPSFLSDVIQNKKKISIDKAFEISRSLGWTWRESQIFLQTAQLGYAKSKRAQQFLKVELQKSESAYACFKSLKSTKFSPISNWYCMAILELTELPAFQDNANWISDRLGIGLHEAQQALSLLKLSNLIVEDDNKKWIKKINASVADVRSVDIRKFHRQHLSNAEKALVEQDFEKRHFSGVTMAINPKKLKEATELIREFRSRMTMLLETGPKESVYHLAIQLFQLDQGKPLKKGEKP